MKRHGAAANLIKRECSIQDTLFSCSKVNKVNREQSIRLFSFIYQKVFLYGKSTKNVLYGQEEKNMSIEELKVLLEAGHITQEQFDEMAKHAKPSDPDPKDPPTDPEPKDPEPSDPIDLDKLDKIIQSRLDKQMAAERKKNADLKKQLERLQKAKLTDDELKQIEIEEREKTIAEREKAITDKENRLYAVKAIKEAGLDDGSDTSLSLVEFVMGEDETEINEKVKAFKELFDKAVTAEVNKRFKDAGYTPKKGDNLNGGVNPYTKEQFNLTKQMELESTNPELAAQLKAAAGVK